MDENPSRSSDRLAWLLCSRLDTGAKDLATTRKFDLVVNEPPSPSRELGVGFGDEQFSLIPPGTFFTGGEAHPRERPVPVVTLTQAFYMQRTPVTHGQWRGLMGTNPSWFTEREYAARAGTTGDYRGTGVLEKMGWYLGILRGADSPGRTEASERMGPVNLNSLTSPFHLGALRNAVNSR